VFQVAFARFALNSQAAVDGSAVDRGPLKIISGEKDRLVPWSVANGAFRRQRRNRSLTQIQEIAQRGHSLTIDSGWEEVAASAANFIDAHHR
jgi:esterase/lipase